MFLAGQPLGPLQQALESKSGVSLYKKILCTYQKFSTDYGLSLWGTVSLWRSILKEKGQKENNIFKEIFLHLYIKTPNTLSSPPYPASPIPVVILHPIPYGFPINQYSHPALRSTMNGDSFQIFVMLHTQYAAKPLKNKERKKKKKRKERERRKNIDERSHDILQNPGHERTFFFSLDTFPQAISIAFTVSCCCSLWEEAEGSYSQHS